MQLNGNGEGGLPGTLSQPVLLQAHTGGDKTLPREVPREPVAGHLPGLVGLHSPYSDPCGLAEKQQDKGKKTHECVVTRPSTLCLGRGLLGRDLPLPYKGVL